MPRFLVRVIVVGGIAAFIPLVAVLLAHILLDVKFSDMTRDVAAIVDVPPLTGILSSLGTALAAAPWRLGVLHRGRV